ncbi:MAG: MogA/MoaB family molybdenum cofactor biosynthesis protein [Thermoanaerobaculia bacterium]
MRAGILTVSDAVAQGRREDGGGPAVRMALQEMLGAEISTEAALPDEPEEIQMMLRRWCALGLDLVAVTGGTGVSPRDRTPEAVRAVIDIEIPGLAERMRLETGRDFPSAYLSRALAGVRGRTLILALPGSPRGAVDCLAAVAKLIPHALSVVRGGADHPAPATG